MMCPKCGAEKTKVIDSKKAKDFIRRRRQCRKCHYRFTTRERYPVFNEEQSATGKKFKKASFRRRTRPPHGE